MLMAVVASLEFLETNKNADEPLMSRASVEFMTPFCRWLD
jgi:hypothetical protein